MKYLLILFLVATFTSINGENATDIEELNKRINELFAITEPTTPVGPSILSLDYNTLYILPRKNGRCKCVPYYLCKNGTTCTKNDCDDIDIRTGNGQCKEYLSLCCEPQDILMEPATTPFPRPINIGCGFSNPKGVGMHIRGDETKFGEFPWMTAILQVKSIGENSQKLLIYLCGGSLIHPKVVLTSAHCVSKTHTYQIRAGDTQSIHEISPHQDRNVVEVIIHHDYNKETLLNDMALLILDTPLEITKNLDTVCLPYPDQILESTRCYAHCFVSGWGKDVFDWEETRQPILKKLNVSVIQRDLCQEQLRMAGLGKYFRLDESFVCAGEEKRRNTCRGDGGSSLVCPHSKNSKRYFQVGIVTWGIGSGLENVPGVYANVAHLRGWVDDNMIRSGYATLSYTKEDFIFPDN